jgi:MFS family permease
VAAGIVMLPTGIAMTIFSPVSARISERWGARTTLVLGASVLCVGNVTLSFLPPSIPLVLVTTSVTSIGAALSYSALPMLIMAAVPSADTAAANSLNTLMRQLGTSSCSAVVAAVAAGFTMAVDGRVLPSATAFTVVFLAAAGAAAAGMVLAALTPRPAGVEMPRPVMAAALP